MLYPSQSISNGFNKPRPGSRTILSTIDFSKAFDSVWHPALFINSFWLASLLALLVGLNLFFLIGALLWFFKITKVVAFQSVGVFRKDPFSALYFSLSSSMIFRPLCLLPSAALFTLTIWPYGPSPPSVPTAVEATQGALFRLERWSEYWCLPVNPSKCEAFFFSVDPHQANLQPNLLLLGSHLRFNSTPTFLGVTFDRTLSFSKHVSSLKAKFFPRLKALRCISASSWGPSKESLSVLYKSSVPSHLRFTRMVSFPKCYQYHQIGTPPPSGQSRHHRLPLVLPYPSASLRGFFTSPTSHPDSFHSFILRAGSLSPNLFSHRRFGQTRCETKTLQIALESFCVHSPAHASFFLF